jgi:hypothetical protein
MDTREQIKFTSQTYQNIEGGITVMRTIARELTITDAQRLAYEKAAAKQQAQAARESERSERQAEWAEWWETRKRVAFRYYMDVLVGVSFLWEDEAVGASWDGIGFHWSFLPFTSIGIQGEAGGFSGDPDYGVGGIIFNGGLVFPLAVTRDMFVSLYGDGLLEINMAPSPEGLLAERVTPGFDCGISFVWDNPYGLPPGFDIKYRGLWYQDRYRNAIGIALTMWFPSLIPWFD